MSNKNVILPSKPRIVSEDEQKGVYEIDGLAPGYGQTLGNSLRRIILSSLPGVAITGVKIEGVAHEFSTIEGVKEDVITILLHLKQVRFRVSSEEPQVLTLSVKGPKKVTAKDIKTTGQVEVLNPDLYICELTTKTDLSMEIHLEHGMGFIQKDKLNKEKVDIGMIAVDAIFSPVRRVSLDVEDMRVGENTNYNRLRINIETDGSISPREALERSIEVMIEQLRSILDFRVPAVTAPKNDEMPVTNIDEEVTHSEDEEDGGDMSETMKTRIDSLNLSTRTQNALSSANIRTVGGVARKKVSDLLEIAGIGDRGIQEIRDVLSSLGIDLKE